MSICDETPTAMAAWCSILPGQCTQQLSITGNLETLLCLFSAYDKSRLTNIC